jgi:hypothetical protein
MANDTATPAVQANQAQAKSSTTTAPIPTSAHSGTAYHPADNNKGPRLEERLTVHRSPLAFSSAALSLVSLPRGSVFFPLTGLTSVSEPAYTSVQSGPNSHIELNSDLVYCNHSCSPTLEFDMSQLVVRVARDRDLRAGDPLTFWYPSTEWKMAQPFECSCGTSACKGWITGAGEMDEGVVTGYWLNPHIEALLDEKAGRVKN